jgi:hypothetical protein
MGIKQMGLTLGGVASALVLRARRRLGGREAGRGSAGRRWWRSSPAGSWLGMVQAAVLSYLPRYAVQALGFDHIGAGLLVACSQAGGAVSRLVLGAASDR